MKTGAAGAPEMSGGRRRKCASTMVPAEGSLSSREGTQKFAERIAARPRRARRRAGYAARNARGERRTSRTEEPRKPEEQKPEGGPKRGAEDATAKQGPRKERGHTGNGGPEQRRGKRPNGQGTQRSGERPGTRNAESGVPQTRGSSSRRRGAQRCSTGHPSGAPGESWSRSWSARYSSGRDRGSRGRTGRQHLKRGGDTESATGAYLLRRHPPEPSKHGPNTAGDVCDRSLHRERVSCEDTYPRGPQTPGPGRGPKQTRRDARSAAGRSLTRGARTPKPRYQITPRASAASTLA